MQQVNVHEFYQFATLLHPLTQLQPGKPLKEYFFEMAWARIWLHNFASDKLIPMAISKPVAWKVIRAIDTLFPGKRDGSEPVDMDKEATYADLYAIVEGVKEFETVLSAELQNVATYFVSKKSIYDTNDLIQRADELFAEPIRQHFAEQVKVDIREAGKSLAFDLGTAAGFHIARAVEGVLIEYLNVLCPNVMEGLKESQRNLGAYIKLASDHEADKKLCASLDQFRDLHRNPLIHPETVLTVDDSLSLLGIAQSAIVLMVLDTVKRRQPSLPLES